MEIEVSKKVRAAIKAKLVELGVHVDEELPDYVMVLVANRRSRVQMEQDLNLFLADNTNRFVIWLHHVLKKLDEVTAHLPIAENKKRKSISEPLPSSKKCKKVEEAETENERKVEGVKEEVGKEEVVKPEEGKEEDKVLKKEKTKRAKTLQPPPPPSPKSIKPALKFTLKSNKKIGKSSLADEDDHTQTQKLTLLDGDNEEEFISLNVNSNEFEFDDLESLRQVALESKSNKSEAKNKDTPQLSQDVNNKSEELENKNKQSAVVDKPLSESDVALESSAKKAEELKKSSPTKSEAAKPVDEKCERTKRNSKSAEKSVSSKSSEKSDRFYRPPRSSHSSNHKGDSSKCEKTKDKDKDKDGKRNSPRRQTKSESEKGSRDKIDKERGSRDRKRLKSVIQVECEAPPKKMKSQVVRKDEEYDPSKPIISTKKLAVNNLILKAVAEAQKSVTEFAIQESAKRKPSIKDRLGTFEVECYSEEDLKKIVIKVPTSPKLKERINIRVDSTEESSDEEYEIIEEIVEEESNKETTEAKEVKEGKEKEINEKQIIEIQSSPKVILNERRVERPLQTVKPLKLPPLVVAEAAQCKYWPTCSFKDKCVFPHPKCKFGAKCTKAECPYKHDKDICKFFPNCHSLSCHFYHPSPCRFGNGCKDKKCVLYHPGRTSNNSNFQTSTFSNFNAPNSLPAKHLLTWKKNSAL